MLENYNIVLASASPRRIEMFCRHGIKPFVAPAGVEENLPFGAGARRAVMFLALKKGLYTESGLLEKDASFFKKLSGRPLIVSADTVVCLRDTILGKPETEEEAFRMLKALCGKTHQVATGVCFIFPGSGRKHVFCEVTQVRMKDYGDREILDYIATGEPMDKAGAYAIQGGWKDYVQDFSGDYDNIVGFPWKRAQQEIGCLEL